MIEVDVAIVGSGAGGGTVAQALAPLVAKGKRVVVFERGPRRSVAHMNGRELEMAELFYKDGGGFAVADRTVTLAFSEGYGGSTQVYTGTSLEPPARIIERWGLDHDDLCARARRYAAENGVDFVPEDLLNDNNKLFRAGCEALGWQATRFPVNLRGCKGTSLCNLGCPNGAKQGTHRVQLPAAEAAGVQVVSRADVRTVQDGVLTVRVDGRPHPRGYLSEWPAGLHQVRAKTVVLCGGAVNTPALLLRSGFDLPALGRFWTCHPAHILVGEHPRPITNAVGHPKSFLWDERIEEDRFFLEACMYFPFVTAKNLTGFGPDHEALMRAFDRLQMILVLACDEALPEHRVAVDADGEPVVHYRLTPATIEAMVKATRAAARIFFAAGAESVHAPSARPTRILREELDRIEARIQARHFKPGTISVSAAHLMGGCRMGIDPHASVTDLWGRVHGAPWLHVADASLFPTALEINPYLTIMALADRVAEAVVDREAS